MMTYNIARITVRVPTSMKVIVVLLGTALPVHFPAQAQESSGEKAAEATSAELFSPEELDTFLAPIALYPDALLAQVLLATTYPVDVLKADRFLSKNAELEDKARSALAADQEWPDPIREMVAGFPQLISRMAEHMDWTEQTGNAVVAQTDDVLASLQRLRAQAKLNGYLVDNEAMTVAEDPDSGSITISSANPDVVYVPQYTETVYTQPAPATPVYVTDDDDWDDYLMTGAVIWGSAIILDEIFDDDDWGEGWNYGYGGGGGNDIDWDGDINIDNGINIGNGNGNGNGNGRPGTGDRPGNGGVGLGDLERPTTLPGRLGDVDPDRLSDRTDGTFKPTDSSRDSARKKIADTNVKKGGVATLPATSGKRDLGLTSAGKTPSLKLPEKPKAAAKADRKPKVAPEKLAKPKKVAKPKAGSKVSKTKKAPVYLPSTGNRSNKASVRGNKSMKGNR